MASNAQRVVTSFVQRIVSRGIGAEIQRPESDRTQTSQQSCLHWHGKGDLLSLLPKR